MAALYLYAFHGYTEPPVDPAWRVAGGGPAEPGPVTVRFTGTSTLLFSDGRHAWMTDGWFSRPGPLRLLLGEIAPDLEAIDAGLARNGSPRLELVFPLHSHYDHAMDAPEVARRTGAVLAGSESTANIGRGWGLGEAQIRVVRDRDPIQVGQFRITPVATRHFEFPDPGVRERALGEPEIAEPLVPPVDAFDYRVGTPYALHVEHPKGAFLVQGSAGYEEEGLAGLEADVVFLGVGGLGSQTETYREAYWRETVERVGARRVVLIHWDSLTGPIEGEFRGPVRVMAFLSAGGDRTRAFLDAKAAGRPAPELWTLPRYDEVVLFP